MYYSNNAQKKFALLNRSGEQISIIKVDDKLKALEYFCQMKQLTPQDLLTIFTIEEVD